jgi:hypothetical protein
VADYEPRDGSALALILGIAKTAATETSVSIGGGPGPNEYWADSTNPNRGPLLYLITSNVEIRFTRYTPPTAPPTAFVTLNFDYELRAYDKNHKGVPILFKLNDASGNLLYQTLLTDMRIQCGHHIYSTQREVNPKYFDVTAEASFEIAWRYLPNAGLWECK